MGGGYSAGIVGLAPGAIVVVVDFYLIRCALRGSPNLQPAPFSTLGQLAGVYRTMPKGGVTDERGKCEDRKGATEELSTAICLCRGFVSPVPSTSLLSPCFSGLGWSGGGVPPLRCNA